MTTISGTPTSGAGAVLMSALVSRALTVLSDVGEATWSQAEVRQWLNDGIADYNQHFSRRATATVTTVAGDQKYDLPTSVRRVLTVEYPSGENPPQYLEERPFYDPVFWGTFGLYDIIYRHDAGNPSEIWISVAPADGEVIGIEYEGVHDAALTNSGEVTVPSEHHHILIAYAVWQASRALQMAEQQNPTSNSSLLMSQLSTNTNYLRREYLDLLAKAVNATEGGGGGFVSWSEERIY